MISKKNPYRADQCQFVEKIFWYSQEHVAAHNYHIKMQENGELQKLIDQKTWFQDEEKEIFRADQISPPNLWFWHEV